MAGDRTSTTTRWSRFVPRAACATTPRSPSGDRERCPTTSGAMCSRLCDATGIGRCWRWRPPCGWTCHYLPVDNRGEAVGGPEWALPGEPWGSRVDADKYALAASPHDAWPSNWPQSWRQPGRVWRADVFDVAAAWRHRSESTRQLLTAVCAWGHGKNGYGPWRTDRTLDVVDLDRRLEALEPLCSDQVTHTQLIEAYEAYGSFRRSRLPWFRPPFFTKLLYFAGYRRSQNTVQPLILDSVVARRLPDNLGVRKPVGARVPQWTAQEWMTYLVWAKDQAGSGEPDRIEMTLFGREGL